MHGIILFFLGLFLAGPSGGGEASNLYPVAVLTETPAGPAFYTGMNVVFSSGSSYDPDGYVVQSKFYINGVLQQTSPNTDTYSTCFALHDYPQAGCYAMASGATTVTLKLEVKDNSGYSRSVSKEYVIKESRSKRYFIKDHLGSVRATVDELGTVIGYDDYYPFGLTMPGRSSNTGNPNDNYKYTGHERDDEAGLTLDYMGARYYDPVVPRFMSIDPLHDKFPGVSPYAYALNNPINLWDPDGRAPTGCCLFAPMGLGVTGTTAKAMAGDQQAKESLKKVHVYNLAVGSLIIPGPEDMAAGAFLLSKTGQALSRMGTRATGFLKGLFRSGDEITSGVSDAIHVGKQGKHIKGHNNFMEGNSELSGDAQNLLDDFLGGNVKSTEKINDAKTRVDFGKTVGNYVDPETGEVVETTVGIIHNSKKGAHIVPARPKKIDDIDIDK